MRPYIKCKKICTTKVLLKIHLKATQHHSYVDEDINVDEIADDEQEQGVDIEEMGRRFE